MYDIVGQTMLYTFNAHTKFTMWINKPKYLQDIVYAKTQLLVPLMT